MKNKELLLAVADAIVMNLWMKDLITTEEKDKILAKNKVSILSN